ncbi:MAG: lactate utilization protein [Desulfobacterium sp.]
MNNHQYDFIRTIQLALGKPSPCVPSELFGSRPEDVEKRLENYKNRSTSQKKALLDLFMEQAALVNIQAAKVDSPASAADAIRELVCHTTPEWGHKKAVIAWDHPLIQQLNLTEKLEKDGVEFFTTMGLDEPDTRERENIRTRLIESYIGITSADFCIARSATLMMRTRPRQPRAISLVPSIHVAVVTADQIIESLKELYFRLKWDENEQHEGLTNCMTFITGPSKTADIELEMVHGAHGPRQLYVYVIVN